MKPGDRVRSIKKSQLPEHEASCPLGEIRQIEETKDDGETIKFYHSDKFNLASRFELIMTKSKNYNSLYHKLL